MSAVFWDFTDRGEGVYTETRENLPELHWVANAAAQDRRPKESTFSDAEEDLFFILKKPPRKYEKARAG